MFEPLFRPVLALDSLYIGEGPWDEPCPQVGDDGYAYRAKQHCRRFIEQIRKHYGDEPEGARLFMKGNPHDFGTYYSIECEFVPALEASVEYAFSLERDSLGVLERWDAEVAA